jgi:hypothetical protein
MKALLVAVAIAAVALLIWGGLAMRRGRIGGPRAKRGGRVSYSRDKPKGSGTWTWPPL